MTFKWTHNGITYTITKSDKPKKKLRAVFINPTTQRQNTIYFGATGYQHFNDRTGLLPVSLNHHDKERRRLYRARHKPITQFDKSSPSLLSYYLLW